MRQLRELCLVRDPDMLLAENCEEALVLELEAEETSRVLLGEEAYLSRFTAKIAERIAARNAAQAAAAEEEEALALDESADTPQQDAGTDLTEEAPPRCQKA